MTRRLVPIPYREARKSPWLSPSLPRISFQLLFTFLLRISPSRYPFHLQSEEDVAQPSATHHRRRNNERLGCGSCWETPMTSFCVNYRLQISQCFLCHVEYLDQSCVVSLTDNCLFSVAHDGGGGGSWQHSAKATAKPSDVNRNMSLAISSINKWSSAAAIGLLVLLHLYCP